MTINYFSLLVCIIGVLLYAFTQNKAQEVGRIMFWTGLLAFLLQVGSGHVVRLP